MEQQNRSFIEQRNAETAEARQAQAAQCDWTAFGSMPGGNSLLTNAQYQESLGAAQHLIPSTGTPIIYGYQQPVPYSIQQPQHAMTHIAALPHETTGAPFTYAYNTRPAYTTTPVAWFDDWRIGSPNAALPHETTGAPLTYAYNIRPAYTTTPVAWFDRWRIGSPNAALPHGTAGTPAYSYRLQ